MRSPEDDLIIYIVHLQILLHDQGSSLSGLFKMTGPGFEPETTQSLEGCFYH